MQTKRKQVLRAQNPDRIERAAAPGRAHANPTPLILAGLACAVVLMNGCATPAQTAGAIAGGVVGVTIAGGYSPGNEIEQVYYLGVFDPQEQVPATVYRL